MVISSVLWGFCFVVGVDWITWVGGVVAFCVGFPGLLFRLSWVLGIPIWVWCLCCLLVFGRLG